MLDGMDYVYWGWWKKETEPFFGDILEFIETTGSRSPLRIGLLSRKDGEYYAADCVGVDFQDGTEMVCPRPDLCPEYYRDTPLPAWFKITRFEQLDEARFKREFGATPGLDPTLYNVVRTGDEFEINPRQTWSMEPLDAPGSSILHLSDLHFGQYHGYPESDRGEGPGQRTLLSTLKRFLGGLGGSRVGVVVVSGDLISIGDANAYPAAESFIEGVLEILELTREHVVIVPGNHDIWLKDVEHPTRDYAHEKPFRSFLQSFYRRDFQDLEWIRRITAGGWDLTFFTLNSARLRTEEMKEYGYVGVHRYEQMLEFIMNTLGTRPRLADRRLVAGVTHHHLLPVPLESLADQDRPVSLALDAGQILDSFQKCGVQVAFHGHQHVPFVGRSSRLKSLSTWDDEDVLVLGGGSCGAEASQLLQEAPFNTVALYEPRETGIHIETHSYTSMTGLERLHDLTVPLR
jgi:predicted MPP superfamily phosphohydrolase